MIDQLIKSLRSSFSLIKDSRASNKQYALVDLLMSAFAMFSLKDPSLLFFRKEYPQRAANLARIYGIEELPSDSALRDSLDLVNPCSLQGQFSPLIANVPSWIALT